MHLAVSITCFLLSLLAGTSQRDQTHGNVRCGRDVMEKIGAATRNCKPNSSLRALKRELPINNQASGHRHYREAKRRRGGVSAVILYTDAEILDLSRFCGSAQLADKTLNFHVTVTVNQLS